MRDINIYINKDHTVDFEDDYLGLNRENLQGNITFHFAEFIDGQARAEICIDETTDGYILLEKVGETYTMPIKSSLLTGNFVIMQLVIDQPEVDDEYPIWKSESFTLKVGDSINATSTIPDDYPSWIEVLEELRTETENAIEQAENVNIESEQLSNGVKVITTDKDGVSTITIVPQGPQGEKGDAGAIKMLIVAELPATGADDTIYLVPYAIQEVASLPTIGTPYTIYIVSGTGKRYVYESNQWIEIGNDNKYVEYVYINNDWEILGGIGVQVDLTDYVKNTDYATSSKGGVVKIGNSFTLDNGTASCGVRGYEYYGTSPTTIFISKGTLENVITGKGLVSNTDYASGSTGGVIRTGNGLQVWANSGVPYASELTYANYQTQGNNIFIGKATLENVLTARIGDIQTLLDDLDSGGGVE